MPSHGYQDAYFRIDLGVVPLTQGRFAQALRDIREGLFGTPVWFHLAWQEVRQRYRRSMLGPFWITISTGAMVGGMGPLYGHLLHQDLGAYFRHLAVGFVIWTFISGYINEVCTAFISSESFIKQVKLPYSMFVMKVLAKNLLIFLHNALIIVVILLCFPPDRLTVLPVALLGFLLVLLNLLWMGGILAMTCARFRDIPQIVVSCMQVLFFLTPVMWRADMLGDKRAVADWNLFYHLIEIVREPLLGGLPDTSSWLIAACSVLVGSCLALTLFSRYRARISYWV